MVKLGWPLDLQIISHPFPTAGIPAELLGQTKRSHQACKGRIALYFHKITSFYKMCVFPLFNELCPPLSCFTSRVSLTVYKMPWNSPWMLLVESAQSYLIVFSCSGALCWSKERMRESFFYLSPAGLIRLKRTMTSSIMKRFLLWRLWPQSKVTRSLVCSVSCLHVTALESASSSKLIS